MRGRSCFYRALSNCPSVDIVDSANWNRKLNDRKVLSCTEFLVSRFYFDLISFRPRLVTGHT